MMIKRFMAFVAALLLFASPAMAAFDVGDIICETTTTTGTGTVNLAGAVSNYVTFVSQIASGNTVPYHIRASDGTLETGIGTFTDGTPDTLTRTADWSTDGSGAELTLPAGTHTVCLGPIAGSITNNPMTENLSLQGFAIIDSSLTLKATFLAGENSFSVTGPTDVDDPYFEFKSTGDGGGGPWFSLFHDSASPVDGDIPGAIYVYGGADDEEIGSLKLELDDGGTGSEDGRWLFNVASAGSSLTALTLVASGITVADDVPLNISTPDNFGFVLNAIGTSAGDGGPSILFNHQTGSPGSFDTVGQFSFAGRDHLGNFVQYANFAAASKTVTNGAEDGAISFRTAVAGTESVTQFSAASGVVIGNGVDYPGAEKLGIEGGAIEFGDGTAATTNTTLARTAAGRLSLEGSQLELAGTQMIYVPAAAMISRATSGADCSKTFDSGAADNTIRVCGFDTGADEWAHFTISMPPRWNEGTITAQYVWTTGGASTPGETVSIDISCVAISDDDGLNNALGTPINVDDTMLSADLDLMTSAVSSAVTCAGTPAANDTVQFGVMRDISDDNVAADMDLIGVRLFITTDTANDG
jgi:hypothetical protein